MSEWAWIAFYICGIALLSLVGVMTVEGRHDRADDRAVCEAKGGYLLVTQWEDICLKREAIIPLR